jgi:hypothetical protein
MSLFVVKKVSGLVQRAAEVEILATSFGSSAESCDRDSCWGSSVVLTTACCTGTLSAASRIGTQISLARFEEVSTVNSGRSCYLEMVGYGD